PDVRFATAGALAAAFAEALSADPGATRVAGAAPTVVAEPPPAATAARTVELPPPPAGRRMSRRRLAAALAVVLLAAGGAAGAVVATRGSTKSAGSSSLRTFVDRVEGVLGVSSSGRRQIGNVLPDGFACRTPPPV